MASLSLPRCLQPCAALKSRRVPHERVPRVPLHEGLLDCGAPIYVHPSVAPEAERRTRGEFTHLRWSAVVGLHRASGWATLAAVGRARTDAPAPCCGICVSPLHPATMSVTG